MQTEYFSTNTAQSSAVAGDCMMAMAIAMVMVIVMVIAMVMVMVMW